MKQSVFPSRREFIKGAGLVGAASVLVGDRLSAKASVPQGAAAPGEAKNLIFLVADGMGTGTLSYANYWQLHNTGAPLNWIEAYRRPGARSALQETASASSPVTDSAAAASAWGGGERVHNRSLNTRPDGSALTPLYTYAREAGKATGLVSTCRLTHATPAGFATQVPHRDMEDAIARQYLEYQVDVLLGGGGRHFAGRQLEAGRQVDLSDFETAGYAIARDRQELRSASGRERLLGVFSDSHVPYAIDRENDPQLEVVPGLDAMFEAALVSLALRQEGFVLQVEGGRIDHAGHVNDPATILREQLEFDHCIARALEFQRQHPDTMVIVTTDHGTGGPQLNGWGDDYNETGAALDRVNRFTASFEAITKRFLRSGACEPDYFRKVTGIELTAAQARAMTAIIDDEPEYPESDLAAVVAGDLLEATAVGWTSNNHTAECVEFQAFGPGAERVPGFLKNFELHGLMRSILNV